MYHDDRPCCRRALAWLHAQHGSEAGASREKRDTPAAPRWLSRRYTWGPCAWPQSWCDLVRRERLDCGGFAALARACFDADDCPVYPVQVVQHYPDHHLSHWRSRWSRHDASADWIGSRFAYHEVCAVPATHRPLRDESDPESGLRGDAHLHVWDPTSATWMRPTGSTTVAVKVVLPPRASGTRQDPTSDADSVPTASWHGVPIPLDRWTLL